MAQTTVRFLVGAVTSSLAVAALLAGPAMTWGIDVPLTSGGTTSQVTSTVQNTVTSTQQTVDTAVTNVQSTVQATVEQAPAPVQQVATSPAPSAPAPVTRTAAAVQKKVASAPKPSRTASHPAASRSATPVATVTSALATPVKATHRVQRAAKSTPLAVSSPATPAPVASTSSSCGGLGLTDLLPAELDLGGLLSIACTALDAIAPSQASSATGVLPSLSLQEILAVTASSASKLRARVAAPLLLPQSSDQQRVAGVFSESRQSGMPSVTGAGFVQRGAVAQWTATPTLPAVAAADAAAAERSGHGHHGAFSKRVDGTKALAWILMADGLILGLLLVWRAARRWVVPRFA